MNFPPSSSHSHSVPLLAMPTVLVITLGATALQRFNIERNAMELAVGPALLLEQAAAGLPRDIETRLQPLPYRSGAELSMETLVTVRPPPPRTTSCRPLCSLHVLALVLARYQNSQQHTTLHAGARRCADGAARRRRLGAGGGCAQAPAAGGGRSLFCGTGLRRSGVRHVHYVVTAHISRSPPQGLTLWRKRPLRCTSCSAPRWRRPASCCA
mgnify:CR=1 FL=1